ncbi:MAG: YihY/virulence factor BrkB family protein [Halorientalis sp.]
MLSVPDFGSWVRRRWPFGWRVYAETKRVNLGFMANSVAFQAFAALLPLFVVVFVIVAFVAGDTLAAQVLTLTEGFLPAQTQQLLATAITSELRATSTSVISVTLLMWGALNLFKGLDTAFSVIYDTSTTSTLVTQTRDALVVFVVLLLAIVGGVGTSSLATLIRVPLLDLLAPGFLFVGLTVVFLPMYYLFPNVDLELRTVLPGTLIAAVGWSILDSLFEVYVTYAAKTTAGVIGTVLLVLTWLYFGSYLLLAGALVNAVLANQSHAPATDDGTPKHKNQ